MRYNVPMLTDTPRLQDYFERIHDVTQYIREHSDEPLNREVLAAVAGFSVPHFHRIFTACLGENMASYIRRMRMERAGRKLRMGQWTLPRLRWLPVMVRMRPSVRRSNSSLV